MNTHKYFLLGLVLALLSAVIYRWQIPRYVGHWHLDKSIGNSVSSLAAFAHYLDFDETGGIHLDIVHPAQYGINGWVDRWNQELNIGGECLYIKAKYWVSGDRMIITGGSKEETWTNYAHRIHPGECDPERDYFTMNGVNLELPVVQDAIAMADTSSEWIFHRSISMFHGYSKSTGHPITLIHGHAPLESIEQLRLIMESNRIKFPERLQHEVKIHLYVDQKLLATSRYRDVVDMIARSGQPGFYQIYRSVYDDSIFDFKRVWIAF